jgi:hypothetical protein
MPPSTAASTSSLVMVMPSEDISVLVCARHDREHCRCGPENLNNHDSYVVKRMEDRRGNMARESSRSGGELCVGFASADVPVRGYEDAVYFARWFLCVLGAGIRTSKCMCFSGFTACKRLK